MQDPAKHRQARKDPDPLIAWASAVSPLTNLVVPTDRRSSPALEWKATVKVYRNGAAVTSAKGLFRIEAGAISFQSQQFSFDLPREFFEARSTDELDRLNIKLVVYHPHDLVEITVHPDDWGADKKLFTVLGGFLRQEPVHQQDRQALYPPLSRSRSVVIEQWINRVQIMLAVGVVSTWIQAGSFNGSVAGVFALAGIAELMRMYLIPLSEDSINPHVLSPSQARRMPSKEFAAFRGGRRNRSDLLPEIEAVPAAPDGHALVPPPQAKSDLIMVSATEAEGNGPSNQYRHCQSVQNRAPEKTFIASIRLAREADGPLSFGESLIQDLGLMTIGQTDISFRGYNMAFRIGGQFVASTKNYPFLSGVAHVPLVSVGAKYWLDLGSEQAGFADAITMFKKNASASSLQSVYPPLTVFTPRRVKELWTRIGIAIGVLGGLMLLGNGQSYGSLESIFFGVVLVLLSVLISRARRPYPSDPRLVESFVQPRPQPDRGKEPEGKVNVGGVWLPKRDL